MSGGSAHQPICSPLFTAQELDTVWVISCLSRTHAHMHVQECAELVITDFTGPCDLMP